MRASLKLLQRGAINLAKKVTSLSTRKRITLYTTESGYKLWESGNGFYASKDMTDPTYIAFTIVEKDVKFVYHSTTENTDIYDVRDIKSIKWMPRGVKNGK